MITLAAPSFVPIISGEFFLFLHRINILFNKIHPLSDTIICNNRERMFTMKKLLFIILSVLFLFLCACSQNSKDIVSKSDSESRLTASPEKLVNMYFEYIEDGNAAGIVSLYSEKYNRDLYPDTENYADAVSNKDALYVTYKGYALKYSEIINSSFSYEAHPENNSEAVMLGYDNANGYGEIKCEAHFVHPVDGDKAVVPFDFIFVQIDGVWYIAL